MNLNFIKNDKDPGYFKLNNSLLLDTEYHNKIKASIQDIVSFNGHANPNVLWEIIKGRIRDETINYASFKKKTYLQNELKIYSKIEDLDRELNIIYINLLENIKLEKQKLIDLIDQRIKGICFKSKAEWVEGSEKNSK